jgi:hypothetical protein
VSLSDFDLIRACLLHIPCKKKTAVKIYFFSFLLLKKVGKIIKQPISREEQKVNCCDFNFDFQEGRQAYENS